MTVVKDMGFNLFLALLLSLFFLLGKDNVIAFTAQFRTSKLSWLYNEIEYFSQKFILTFGKVIETQLLIALFNTVFTVIGLWILGFPNLFGLALMVFVLGLIPVAGVIISLIPLSAIAFSIGGLPTVIYLLVFIMLIHAMEAYVLNPRLMASKTHLPIFYTFVVLIFSEHFFGVWGLIVGIPSFVFLLDILEVKKWEPRCPKTDLFPKKCWTCGSMPNRKTDSRLNPRHNQAKGALLVRAPFCCFTLSKLCYSRSNHLISACVPLSASPFSASSS